jgi:hypothetical protein
VPVSPERSVEDWGEGNADDLGDQISIRQNFRFNGDNYYTIFDVPISVTNRIEESDGRPPCDSLANALLSPEEIDAGSANGVGVLFAPDDAVQVEFDAVDDNDGGNGSNDDNGDGASADENQGGYEDGNGDGPGFAGDEDQGDFGGTRPEGDPGDGLGSGAPTISVREAFMVSCIMMVLVMAVE